MHADWMLERAEVLNTASGLKTTFSYSDWVPAKAETATEITAASSEQIFHDYQVLYTKGGRAT